MKVNLHTDLEKLIGLKFKAKCYKGFPINYEITDVELEPKRAQYGGGNRVFLIYTRHVERTGAYVQNCSYRLSHFLSKSPTNDPNNLRELVE